MLNKCRNGIKRLNGFIKTDEEINQGISYIILLSSAINIVGGIFIGYLVWGL